jgi:hypothetical protein
MSIQEVHVQRVNLVTTEPFDTVVARIDAQIGHPDMTAFRKSLSAAQNEAEIEKVVNPVTQPNGLMEFTRFDHGELLQKENGTGANSHYNGLQLTAIKRLGHGLQGQVNYTWSHCMDTVSNGGFLPFSAGGILSPLPGDLARDYGPCDYDIRHSLNAQYVYQLPIRVHSHSLGSALNGWQISGTAFWHSGVPFSVLSTPIRRTGTALCRAAGRSSPVSFPAFRSIRIIPSPP